MPNRERAQKLAAALAALTAVLPSACNDERAVASRYLKRVLVLAQVGAFIQITAEDSPELAGTTLEIGPDALTANTFITVELSPTTIAREPAGPAVAFGPSGIMLQTDSRLWLPFTASRPGQRPILEAEEEDGQRWTLTDPTEIEGAPARLVSVAIQRLAVFQAGWPPLPACPSPIISEAHAPAGQSMDVRSSSARRSSMNVRTKLAGMLMAGCLPFGCVPPQEEPAAEQSDLRQRSRNEDCLRNCELTARTTFWPCARRSNDGGLACLVSYDATVVSCEQTCNGPCPPQNKPPAEILPPPPRPATPPSASCANPAVEAVPLLQAKCGALCHNPDISAANLDLFTPGAKARLLNVSSKLCRGKILVTDGAAGVGGHLFDKIAGTVAPDCPGTRMPPIGVSLTAAEIKCLKDWIRPSP